MSFWSNAFSTFLFVATYHGINNCPYVKGKFDSWNKIIHKIAQNPPSFD